MGRIRYAPRALGLDFLARLALFWLTPSTLDPQDKAILRSSLSLTPIRYALAHGQTTWSSWGTRVMVRFALLPVLDYFLEKDPEQLQRQGRNLLPVVASAWGRTEVLEWALKSRYKMDPPRETVEEAVDDASRHGQVAGEFHFVALLCCRGLALNGSALTLRLRLPFAPNHHANPPKLYAQSWTFGSTRACLCVCFPELQLTSLAHSLMSLSPSSRPPLADYSEKALASATIKRQLGSLEWWRNSGLPLKIGNVVSLQSGGGGFRKERSMESRKLTAEMPVFSIRRSRQLDFASMEGTTGECLFFLLFCMSGLSTILKLLHLSRSSIANLPHSLSLRFNSLPRLVGLLWPPRPLL